jgi:ribonuclease D
MKRGTDYTTIDREEDLVAVVPELQAARVLALDTESDSLYRYQERVCFLQIAVGTQAWLVDTLAVRNLEPLRGIFEGPQLKVFHGADYDLSCMLRDFGFRFANVFDTMIAAQLLGREQLGLAALDREFYGVELDKSLTRHDWGARPLEPRHVRYLVEDVVHLTGVYEHVSRELAAQDLLEEASLEFERLLQSIGPKAPFDPEGFRSIRGANTLGRAGLSILRELYLLRDKMAARADKPPFKVFGNHHLIAIAEAAPLDLDALWRATRFPSHMMRRFGDVLLDAVEAGLDNQEQVPLRNRPKGTRPPEIQVAWVDALKAWRRDASERDRRTTMAILPNHLLFKIADLRPTTLTELAQVPLLGNRRLERYGEQILAAVRPLGPRAQAGSSARPEAG